MPQVKSAPLPPSFDVTVGESPCIAWTPDLSEQVPLLSLNLADGIAESIGVAAGASAVELVLGIDFGTSCTKVVISDRSSGAAHAVPFTSLMGVGAYLLPSRLGITRSTYCLEHRETSHRDLKLAMLKNLESSTASEHVCAYLALVIRAARAWLFTRHGKQYQGKDIVWSLAIGQPANQSTSVVSRQHFQRLGEVAWRLASLKGGVTVKKAEAAWASALNGTVSAVDLEVLVMPELAAQIHGFVTSSSFEVGQKNRFLLIDVGAGTLDASLFRVVKTRGGQFDFEFFTNSVEANGAAMLHRRRVNWWLQRLEGQQGCTDLCAALKSMHSPTDLRGSMPASYTDYLAGVSVTCKGGALNPDAEFDGMLRKQVVGNVVFAAFKQGLLRQEELTGTPFFMCGGGSQHPLFLKLEKALEFTSNATWLRCVKRNLTLPKDLKAPGIHVNDYHRLSVAYGLSRLNLGRVQQVEKFIPAVKEEQNSDWQSGYVSKDTC